jgi:flagellar hook-associated protein 2
MATTQPTLNVGGLASGLDTNSIIQQLMAVEAAPRNKLQTQQTLAQATQTLLQGFQTQLQSLSSTLTDLRSPTLFTQTQQVDSSDTTKVIAVGTSGAGIGGYQLDVSQLANSAQRTFSFTSPASAGTITIDGHATAIAAGASIQDVASAINSDASATVYAASTDSGTLVLSNRATGDTGAGFIAVADSTGSLTEQTAKAKQGKDAQFTVDGVAGSSHSNTVTSAVAGVSLTLKGVTTTSGPVTVTVGAPGASTDAIQSALQAFVSSYNSTIAAIQAKLSEKSVPNATTTSDQEQGLLFGDTQLNDLLSTMRQAIYDPIPGLPDGMNSLADLGVSTGDTTGTVSQDSLSGTLTLDTDKLTAAIQTNPSGVRDVLAGTASAQGWAQRFGTIVDGAAGPGGTLDSRITSEGDEIKDLASSISDWNDRLTLRQTALQAQFTAMETALSQSQSQAQWLSGQIASLPAG